MYVVSCVTRCTWRGSCHGEIPAWWTNTMPYNVPFCRVFFGRDTFINLQREKQKTPVPSLSSKSYFLCVGSEYCLWFLTRAHFWKSFVSEWPSCDQKYLRIKRKFKIKTRIFIWLYTFGFLSNMTSCVFVFFTSEDRKKDEGHDGATDNKLINKLWSCGRLTTLTVTVKG